MDQAGSLKRGGLGLVGLTTIGAAMLSPVMGIYGNFGPIGGSVGIAVPLVFVAALIVSLPTAISYSVVSREIPSAGSAFAWIRRTTTPAIATWVGLVMTAYYIICVVLQPMLFGLFWNDFLKLFGVADPGVVTWLVGVAVSTVVAMLSTYRGVAVSTRVSVAIIAIEVGVLLALSTTIFLAKSTQVGGISLAPFAPSSVQGGLAGFSSAMVVGIMVYTGYDVVSTVAEETDSPRRLLPIATMLSLILVAIIWIFSSWAMALAVNAGDFAQLNASGFTAVTPIAKKYWGAGDLLVTLTGMSAALGVYVATVTGASRALYSMARDGHLPAVFARLHPKYEIPWNAIHTVFALALVFAVVLTLYLGNIVEAYTWWAGPIAFLALITYVAVNASNIIYFRRFERAKANLFVNLIVPVFGIILCLYVLWTSFFVALWQQNFTDGKSIVLVCLVFAVLSAVYAWTSRLRHGPTLMEPSV